MLKKSIISINRWAFYVSAVLLFSMMLIMLYEVIMRYAFNAPTIWSTEVTGYLVVIICFLGLGHVLHLGGHVNVDTVQRLFSKRIQVILNLIFSLLTLAYIALLLWQSGLMAWNSYRLDINASSLFGTPQWIPQLFLPLGSLLLCLQLIRFIFEYAAGIIKR